MDQHVEGGTTIWNKVCNQYNTSRKDVTEVCPSTLGRPNVQKREKRFKSAHEYHNPKTSNVRKHKETITPFSSINTNHDKIHVSPVKKRKEHHGCF